jgi:protein TonB
MIPRVIVPTNARISSKQSDGPIAVRQDLLVPRNLIPADARISEAVEASGASSSATETVADSRRLMVPKLLVPPGARIGTEAKPEAARGASPVAHANVFDEALLGNSSLGHRRSPAEWLVSLGVHAAILAVVLIVPLFYTQVIDLQQFETTYLAAPPTPAGPPPPPPPAVAAPRQPLHKIFATTAKLTMPTAVPKTVQVPSSVEEAPSDVTAGVPGGVLGGVPSGVPGGVLGGILGGAGPSAPPPPPVAVASTPSEPLQVGGQVKPPRALSRPAPEYPILAKQARIQGVVEVDAVIDTHGNVIQARAMSGPQMLFSAALKAVTGWKYEPTYLNGQAYPVELTVQVTFSLG